MTCTSKSNKHYEWSIMPDLYVATALLLLEHMMSCLELNNSPNFDNEKIVKRLGLRSSHPNDELILPLIFNFKHGMELYIKTIGIIDYGKYEIEHDFKILMKEIKKNSKGTENEKLVKQLCMDVWPIIKKYYYGRYIPMNRGSNFADKKNEAERYPEYKSRRRYGKTYKIPERYEWVTDTILKEIKKDILLIESKFGQTKRKIVPTKRFFYERTNR